MSAKLNHARVVLDHVTLRTNDLEGTRAFLETVLDLKLSTGLLLSRLLALCRWRTCRAPDSGPWWPGRSNR
jgi:hypothetical protein